MLHNKGEMQAKIMLNDRLQKVTPRSPTTDLDKYMKTRNKVKFTGLTYKRKPVNDFKKSDSPHQPYLERASAVDKPTARPHNLMLEQLGQRFSTRTLALKSPKYSRGDER